MKLKRKPKRINSLVDMQDALCPEPRILCLDAAFTNMGVAVWSNRATRFVHTECVVTKPTPKKQRHMYVVDDNVRRIQEITIRLTEIVDEHRPRCVLAELPVGGAKSAKAAGCMAMATAIVATVCAVRNIRLYPIQPSQIKRIVGSGAVSKDEVQDYIRSIHGISCLPSEGIREHIADAMMLIEVAKRSMQDILQ